MAETPNTESVIREIRRMRAEAIYDRNHVVKPLSRAQGKPSKKCTAHHKQRPAAEFQLAEPTLEFANLSIQERVDRIRRTRAERAAPAPQKETTPTRDINITDDISALIVLLRCMKPGGRTFAIPARNVPLLISAIEHFNTRGYDTLIKVTPLVDGGMLFAAINRSEPYMQSPKDSKLSPGIDPVIRQGIIDLADALATEKKKEQAQKLRMIRRSLYATRCIME